AIPAIPKPRASSWNGGMPAVAVVSTASVDHNSTAAKPARVAREPGIIAMRSERLGEDQPDQRDQQQQRDLVEPAQRRRRRQRAAGGRALQPAPGDDEI